MNKSYFYKNFYKLKAIASDIESFFSDYGIDNDNHLKILKKATIDILNNKDKILEFLQEKTTEAFKDLSNSDLIIITLLNIHFKQAKKEIAEYKNLTDAKQKKEVIARQELLTIKKLFADEKFEIIPEIIKQIAKVRVEVALVVRPKKDSLRILIMKLIIEILNAIIQYEKQFVKTDKIDNDLKKYESDYSAYCDLVNVDVVLDFKNFDASRWDKILVANIDYLRYLIIDIKKESDNTEKSMLDDKTVILAINTINNLHDLLSELKRIKDGPTFQKYFREKYYKFLPPLVKAYNTNINWVGAIDILKKTGWNDLLSMLPRKIRKQHTSKK